LKTFILHNINNVLIHHKMASELSNIFQ